jgi:ADP-ribose pyrophosphatase YjhB (NUDIX family)
MVERIMPQRQITHFIERYILRVLAHQKVARFRDMKPGNVDSNLYAYHLKLLIRTRLVEKTEGGYRLTARGLFYVDRVNNESFNVRNQYKIITMSLLKNSKEEILLTKRDKQPFITRWTLPSGKIHLDDRDISQAATRELHEKIGLDKANLRHAGDCYIRVRDTDDQIISAVFAHIFTGESSWKIPENRADLAWTDEKWRVEHKLAPAVEDIIKLCEQHNRWFSDLNYQIDLS